MSTCICGQGIENLGYTGCISLSQAARKLFFQSMNADDGTKNEIDLSMATFDETFWQGLLSNANRTKRINPTPNLDNTKNDKAEPIFEDFDDKTKVFVTDNVRTFTCIIEGNKGGTFNLAAKINKLRCVKNLTAYIVDKTNNLFGYQINEGKLSGIKIDSGSISALPQYGDNGKVQQIAITFNWSPDVEEENIKYIPANEMEYPPLYVEPLVDAYAKYSAKSKDGFTAELYLKNDDATNSVKDGGLVKADFTVKDGAADITDNIASVTETEDGIYAFVFTTALIVGTHNIVLVPSKTGVDYKFVTANPCQIIVEL